jgi:hypothetical protein
MPTTTIEAQAERRTNVADWITAVFGIFWSVWWGFFINRVLEDNPSDWIKNIYILMSVLITCSFSVVYVRWLWNIQKIAYKMFLLSSFIGFSAPLLFLIAFFLSAIGIAGILFSIPSPLILYGAVLTIIWPIVVVITLWTG